MIHASERGSQRWNLGLTLGIVGAHISGCHMSSWNRREVVYVRPDPKPETVADLYSRLLEASPFTPLAHALAYFIGKNTDKSQALACAKQLAIDPETHLRCAGAVALAQLHQEGLRDSEDDKR